MGSLGIVGGNGLARGTGLKPDLQRRAYRHVKPCLDRFFALCLLVFLMPWLLIGLAAVAATSPGPLMHRRRGAGRPSFDVLKIRTMRVDADEQLNGDPQMRARWLEKRKLSNDPRVIPVGRWLRRWAIDEIPQLFNVLRGEMSLIGPRPISIGELDAYGDRASELLSVKPGLTGLWQVSGRHRLTIPERVELDLRYARETSLPLDLWILLQTPRIWLGIESGW